jgi:hypothetical protein
MCGYWKEVKRRRGNNKTSPIDIDGVKSKKAIASLFGAKFSSVSGGGTVYPSPNYTVNNSFMQRLTTQDILKTIDILKNNRCLV